MQVPSETPNTAPRIWNLRRQIFGNLIPLMLGVLGSLLTWVLLSRLATSTIVTNVSSGIAFILGAYFGINRFGFYENSQMATELMKRLAKELPSESEPLMLIGLVYDRPATVFDAHAEVGFMLLSPGGLKIWTEDRTLDFQVVASKVSRGFNIHALIGLGGWIRLDWENSSIPLLIESRQFPTMFRSKIATQHLYQKMRAAWRLN